MQKKKKKIFSTKTISDFTFPSVRLCAYRPSAWTWSLRLKIYSLLLYKNSAEGVIAPAGAKVRGATIRMWLLNKFISFLAVLSWKTGFEKNVDKVPSGAHIFQASVIPSNGYIFSTDFLYYTAQW